jgi:hypothetical protein
MRRDLLSIAVALLGVITVAALVAGCTGLTRADILSVTTDKELYHSNNVMNITVAVTSPRTIDNITLNITGIEDRYGDFRLSHEIQANLSPGTNTLTYDYQLPPCSKCAGLEPGNYSFNVTLEQYSTILDQTNYTIQLEQ